MFICTQRFCQTQIIRKIRYTPPSPFLFLAKLPSFLFLSLATTQGHLPLASAPPSPALLFYQYNLVSKGGAPMKKRIRTFCSPP